MPSILSSKQRNAIPYLPYSSTYTIASALTSSQCTCTANARRLRSETRVLHAYSICNRKSAELSARLGSACPALLSSGAQAPRIPAAVKAQHGTDARTFRCVTQHLRCSSTCADCGSGAPSPNSIAQLEYETASSRSRNAYVDLMNEPASRVSCSRARPARTGPGVRHTWASSPGSTRPLQNLSER
jgi:hypothetical protein